MTVNIQLHNNIFSHLESFSNLYYIESALRWIFLFALSRQGSIWKCLTFSYSVQELVRKRRSHVYNLYSGLLNLAVFTKAQKGNKVDRERCLCTGCFLPTVARLSHNLHMN